MLKFYSLSELWSLIGTPSDTDGMPSSSDNAELEEIGIGDGQLEDGRGFSFSHGGNDSTNCITSMQAASGLTFFLCSTRGIGRLNESKRPEVVIQTSGILSNGQRKKNHEIRTTDGLGDKKARARVTIHTW
jgi:hypothetical protein